jgi:hypothetical protein
MSALREAQCRSGASLKVLGREKGMWGAAGEARRSSGLATRRCLTAMQLYVFDGVFPLMTKGITLQVQLCRDLLVVDSGVQVSHGKMYALLRRLRTESAVVCALLWA